MKTEAIDLNSELITLLDEAGLPVSDLYSSTSLSLFGVRQNGLLIGAVGIEAYGEDGLIRSLVVASAWRGSGLGLNLVLDVELHAVVQGISTLYLLTTTAADFFTRIGNEPVDRAVAPTSIAETVEFKTLCPASAVLMRKGLHPET